MKLTFIAPQGVRIEAVSEAVKVGELGNRHGSFEGKLDRVKATAEPGTSFFVVATFQKKDPPAVSVESGEKEKGLAAKVTISKRTVRFDGQKIVLGE